MTLPISCPVKPFLVRITVSFYLVECSMMFLAGPTFLTCINLWPQVQEKWMLASVPHGLCLERKVSTSLTITISKGKLSAPLFHLIAHDCTSKEKNQEKKKKSFAPSYVKYQKSGNLEQTELPYWLLELAHVVHPSLTATGSLCCREDVILQSVNLGLLLGKECHCTVKGCRISSEVN